MAETASAVLGVDVGTASTKGVLVALDGTILRSTVREHSVQRPAPGHVEMDPEIWWSEFVSIAQELTAPGDATVTAVGVSGMGPCVALTDADGAPVRPAILYGVDTRAEEQIHQLTNVLGREEVLAHCGALLTSQSAGPKISWVAQNEPAAYARARRVFMPASYLAFRLTGEYVMDHISASQSPPLYCLRRQDWHTDWAEHVAPGLELPALRWAGEAAGTVSAEITDLVPGLPAGIPVISGTIDAWAEAVSAGATRPGDLMLMYGTTTFLVATTDEPVASRTLWPTSGLTEGAFSLAGGMAASGAITGWLRDLTGEVEFTDLVIEAEQSEPGANGLVMLPYFSGERSPIADPSARGVVAGLTLSHTRGDLYRAALEAAAYGVRHHLETLEAAGLPISRVTAVGGGAQHDLWPQIVSDVTGLTQQIPRSTVGASYGGARLAAELAHGTDTSGWNPSDHRCIPNPAHRERYDELYRLYRELYPATRDISHALARLQQD
ncbi:sugar kinase [Brachybacterium avium]|uniref:Sugar kinase n=1 Tax=Brachybacterium avium TaxID=2017485 RepID=A0A220UCN5_9MICO|nr:FGGY-family carbohydrate kinase [Brachybacterium avium]ASK65672.1 sugar kinase [Brachybacterium avium]